MKKTRSCLGAKGREGCGNPLPRNAVKYCLECRHAMARYRRAVYNQKYFQRYRREIVSKRLGNRQMKREEERADRIAAIVREGEMIVEERPMTAAEMRLL